MWACLTSRQVHRRIHRSGTTSTRTGSSARVGGTTSAPTAASPADGKIGREAAHSGILRQLDTSQPAPAMAKPDASAEFACTHFRNIMGDLDVLTVTDCAASCRRLTVMHRSESAAIRTGARAMLAQLQPMTERRC
jgi:hypothetical protein